MEFVFDLVKFKMIVDALPMEDWHPVHQLVVIRKPIVKVAAFGAASLSFSAVQKIFERPSFTEGKFQRIRSARTSHMLQRQQHVPEPEYSLTAATESMVNVVESSCFSRSVAVTESPRNRS